MKNFKLFLASFLVIPLSVASQESDEGKKLPFSIRPVFEYELEVDADFRTSNGTTGIISVGDGMAWGLDIGVDNFLGNKNLRLEGNYRYRKAEMDNIHYHKIDAGDFGSQGVSDFIDEQLRDAFNSTTGEFGKIEDQLYGFSLWYKFDRRGKFEPYIGGGAYYRKVENEFSAENLQDSIYGNSSTGYSFSLGAGFEYGISDNTSLNMGYRYRRHGDIEFKGANNTTATVEGYASHAMIAGINISF